MNCILKGMTSLIFGAFILSGLGHAQVIQDEWFEALKASDSEKVLSLVKTNPDLINAQNGKGYTAIILSSYNNQLALTKELIALGGNACLPDNKGNSALMGVIFKGHDQMAIDLMEKCNVNHQNNNGQTALMFASLFGKELLVEELLKRGANVDLKDNDGRTAIGLAKGQWNLSVVKILKTSQALK
jgi:ankyrin repeat protein